MSKNHEQEWALLTEKKNHVYKKTMRGDKPCECAAENKLKSAYKSNKHMAQARSEFDKKIAREGALK